MFLPDNFLKGFRSPSSGKNDVGHLFPTVFSQHRVIPSLCSRTSLSLSETKRKNLQRFFVASLLRMTEKVKLGGRAPGFAPPYPEIIPVVSSSHEKPPAHRLSVYRCFLPDLTGFTDSVAKDLTFITTCRNNSPARKGTKHGN